MDYCDITKIKKKSARLFIAHRKGGGAIGTVQVSPGLNKNYGKSSNII